MSISPVQFHACAAIAAGKNTFDGIIEHLEKVDPKELIETQYTSLEARLLPAIGHLISNGYVVKVERQYAITHRAFRILASPVKLKNGRFTDEEGTHVIAPTGSAYFAEMGATLEAIEDFVMVFKGTLISPITPKPEQAILDCFWRGVSAFIYHKLNMLNRLKEEQEENDDR